MSVIDPAWAGTVQFYELCFGSWLAYLFLVLMWERVLREPLAEWKYLLVLLMGASAFLINHYFQNAPLWSTVLNAYTLMFLVAYYFLCVSGSSRSAAWKIAAVASAVVFTVAFIVFENIARYFVDRHGYSEFWFMLMAFVGFFVLIIWRGARKR